MQADDEVMRFTTGAGLSDVENRKQLDGCIRAYSKPDNDFWVWAVVNKPDREFVGTCAVVRNDQSQDEIGYRLLRRHWGCGFGQEICDALIDYIIQNMGLKQIYAFVDERNVASMKILNRSKLEFIEEVRTDSGNIDRTYRWTH